MLEHWFIIASQKTVRILIEVQGSNKFKQIKVLDNPLGRERNRALIRKQAGRGIKSMGRVATVYYSQTKRHDPHEEAALQFSREIAKFLEVEKQKKSVGSLTIVAEPHFLGKIKNSLSPDVKKIVVGWIKKDLQKKSQEDLNH
ncbi:MAG: host attachment protein, partial [Pseudobdellovibrionaceae bacterium]